MNVWKSKVIVLFSRPESCKTKKENLIGASETVIFHSKHTLNASNLIHAFQLSNIYNYASET